MRTGFALAQQGRIRRFQCDDLYGRFLFLQIFTYTGQGTAGTYAGYEDVHFAVGVFIDFRARGGFVGRRVGRVVELFRNEAAGDGGCQFLGFFHGTGDALCGFRQHHFRTVGGNHVPPFDGHGFRHHHDGPIAFHGSYRSQADARVAAGGFDDGAAGFQGAPFFRIFNHGLGNPVFGRTSRVEAFQFHQQAGCQVLVCSKLFRFQQGGMANQIQDTRIYFRHNILSFDIHR